MKRTEQDFAFTDKQWWQMCDIGMSLPVPLGAADPTRPFVYERDFGLFYVEHGHHQAAMSLLLAWRHGCDRGAEVALKLNLELSSGTADRWLETAPGAAFRSSVGDAVVRAGRRGSLSPLEVKLLSRAGSIQYLLKAEN